MESKTALIVGATGLVGSQILDMLLKEDYYDKIIVASRRSIGLKDKRINEVIFDLDEFNEFKDQILANDYYCSIGTTMKKAGSKEAFMKVDYDFPIKLAERALEDPNFERFLMVSSYGAKAESSLFYNEVKGKTENALKELNLKSLLIFQPSLLLGERDDFRFFEEIAKVITSILSFFIIGTRLRFWAIKATDVAKSMFIVAKKKPKGTHIFKPQDMMQIVETNDQ